MHVSRASHNGPFIQKDVYSIRAHKHLHTTSTSELFALYLAPEPQNSTKNTGKNTIKMPSVRPGVARDISRRWNYQKSEMKSKLASLLRNIDPLTKEMTQRKLFIEQYVHGVQSSTILHHVDLDPLLKRELEPLYEPVDKVLLPGVVKQTTTFSIKDLDKIFTKFKRHEIVDSHRHLIEQSCVLIFIRDDSNTVTNRMFTDGLVRRVEQLKGGSNVETKNMDTSVLSELISWNDNKEMFGDSVSGNLLKVVCIPPHALGVTQGILEILQSQVLFPIVGVYFNLRASSTLRVELQSVLQHREPSEINYDSLLKMANGKKDTNTTDEIVTTIGQMGLVQVGIATDGISFT